MKNIDKIKKSNGRPPVSHVISEQNKEMINHYATLETKGNKSRWLDVLLSHVFKHYPELLKIFGTSYKDQQNERH